ncbi:MAG TPA: sulfite exporter TauE/SafE family protein [Chthonomonadales bacterium]|nr:sulfite exporter TauE/SafE family protein [Chthonomonadales bacterium]
MTLNDTLAGLIVGTLVGLTGMGGASLMAPILIFLFHYKARIAIGSDLAYGGIARSFGAWQHRRAGNVNIDLVRRFALGSVPASLMGVWLVHSIDLSAGKRADQILTRVLGVVLILVALVMIARSIPKLEHRMREWSAARRPSSPATPIVIGAVGGFLVGLTSVGSGTLFGVALLLVFGLGVREMVGTDIYHAAILTAVAAAGHIYAQDVNYTLVAGLLTGAIPGILLGGYLSTRMPERLLRPTLAAVMLVSGVRSVF